MQPNNYTEANTSESIVELAVEIWDRLHQISDWYVGNSRKKFTELRKEMEDKTLTEQSLLLKKFLDEEVVMRERIAAKHDEIETRSENIPALYKGDLEKKFSDLLQTFEYLPLDQQVTSLETFLREEVLSTEEIGKKYDSITEDRKRLGSQIEDPSVVKDIPLKDQLERLNDYHTNLKNLLNEKVYNKIGSEYEKIGLRLRQIPDWCMDDADRRFVALGKEMEDKTLDEQSSLLQKFLEEIVIREKIVEMYTKVARPGELGNIRIGNNDGKLTLQDELDQLIAFKEESNRVWQQLNLNSSNAPSIESDSKMGSSMNLPELKTRENEGLFPRIKEWIGCGSKNSIKTVNSIVEQDQTKSR
jgi:hypothetical protein